MNINWITIKVNDLEKSKQFYNKYLGMKVESEFSVNEFINIVFFEAKNGIKIELIHDKNIDVIKIDTNSNISIGITSHRYYGLLSHARETNIITIEPTILGGGLECFFVSDPNGVGIQIIKP